MIAQQFMNERKFNFANYWVDWLLKTAKTRTLS